MKTVLFVFCLFSCFQSFSQNNKPFTWYMYQDSLHDALPKDANGRIYKDGELQMDREGKLHIYMVSDQFEVFVLIKTPAGKWIKKEGTINAKQFYTNPEYSCVDFDTTLDETGKYIFYFTSMAVATKGKFAVQVVYAPKESIYADNNEKKFCNQLGFLFKHAETGFRFMKSDTTRYQDKRGNFSYFYYHTIVPAAWFGDPNQRIERINGLDWYRYHALLFSGSYSDAQAKFKDLREQVKNCLGEQYSFEDKTDSKGTISFRASIKDPNRIIIKTWTAWEKGEKLRIDLSLVRNNEKPDTGQVFLEFSNMYESMQ